LTATTPTSALLYSTSAYVSSGLVSYYDFSNASSYSGSGTALNDITGNYNLTLSAAGTYNASPPSMSWTTAMNASMTNATLNNRLTTGGVTTLSMEILFYPTTNAPGSFFSLDNGTSSAFNLYGGGAGQVGIRAAATAGLSTLITANVWQHLVFTYSGTTNPSSSNPASLAIYFNGTAATMTNLTTLQNTIAAITPFDTIVLGNFLSTTSLGLAGKIAMARIYNVVLTPAQVLTNYNAAKAVASYGI
jgi:hypothetical protein